MKKGLVFPRRAGGGNGNVVSLFPFLAVLLCTMGALIMLLVVIAQRARLPLDNAPVAGVVCPEPKPEPEPPPENKEEPGEEENRPTRDEVEKILALLKQREEDAAFFAGELKDNRKILDEKLVEERAKLAYLEKQAQSKREELKRLAQITRELEKTESDRSEAMEDLRKEVAEKTAQLAQADEEIKQLREESLTKPKSYAIIPFKGRDGTFRKPMFIECRGNKIILQPEGIELGEADILVGDRPDNPLDAALRAQRQYLIETGQLGPGEEPYPLFIVRPSGIDMFGGARASLGSWHSEFGYELVGEDIAIEYPLTNPELKHREETQVAIARERCAGYLAMLREEMRRRPPQQYRIGPGGQVERIDSGGGSRFAGPGGHGPGGRGPGGRGAAGRSSGDRDLARGGRPELPGGFNAPAENRGNADGDSISLLEPSGGTGTPDAHLPPVISRDSIAGKTGTPYAETPFDDSPSEPLTSVPPPGLAGTTNTERLRLHNRQGKSGAPTFSGGTASPEETVGDGSVHDGSVELGVPDFSTETPTLANAPRQAGTAQGAGSSAPQETNGAQPTMLQTPTVTIGTNMQPDDWGQPEAATQSTAVTRSVTIRCEQDAITLPRQPGLRRAVRIDVDPSSGLAVRATRDAFLQAIRDHMESWGIAGSRMYWQPVLKVEVAPGAEQRFKELERALRGSGILIERH